MIDNIDKITKNIQDISDFIDGLEYENIERFDAIRDLSNDFINNTEEG